jgi:hypothetical protein
MITAGDLMPTIKEYGFLMETGNFKEIDDIFRQTVIDEKHPAILMSMLRTTFMCREKITGWYLFLDRAEESIRVRGYDADSMLYGLKASKNL